MKLRIAAASGEITLEEVYLPAVDEVRAGDLLFTRNMFAANPLDVARSRTICTLTGGSFSHVALCMVTPVFIEAIGSGVSNLTLSRYFAVDVKNVRVRRYHDAAIAKSAAGYAASLLGQPYSNRRAIATRLPVGRAKRRDYGTICSHLVWQSYAQAQAPEFLSLDEASVTPATLEALKGFEDVTHKIFRKGRTPNHAEELSALDGDRVPGVADAQASVLASYLKPLVVRFEKVAESYPQFEVPRTVLDAVILAGSILLAAHEAGQSEADLTREIRGIDLELAKSLEGGELNAMLEDGLRMERLGLKGLEYRAQQVEPDIDFVQLKQVFEAGRMTLSSRRGMVSTLEELSVVSRSAAWMHQFQVRIADSKEASLARQQAVLQTLGLL